MLHHQNYSRRRSCKGNLLLMVILLTTISGILTVATFSFIQQQAASKYQVQRILGEKQVLSLAKYTFKRLKQLASKNNIITCRKGCHFHFYEVTKNEPYVKDLGTLDQTLSAKDGYITVLPIYTTTQPACRFYDKGYRIALADAMKETSLFYFLSPLQQQFVRQRWSALQQGLEIPLSLDLFAPFIQEIDWSSHLLQITLWNPYDRLLSGHILLELTVSIDEHGIYREECNSQSFLNITMHPGKIQKLTVTLPSDSQKLNFSLCGLHFQAFKIGQYRLKSFDLNQNLWAKDHTLTQQRRPVKWTRARPTQPTPTDSSFWTSSSALFDPKILCSTKTWYEQLNACLFFQDGTPYHKIGNFDTPHKYIQDLNAYFWNNIVPTSGTAPFWFNSERSLLARSLSEYLHRAIDVFSDEIEKIISAQPFHDAYTFVKWAQKKLLLPIQLLGPLHARSEVFEIFVQKIIAGCMYTCTMRIERNISTHKWRKIYVHLNNEPIKKH